MFYKKKSHSLAESNLKAKFSKNALHCDTITKDSNDLKTDVVSGKLTENRNSFLGFFYTFLASTIFALASVIVKKFSYITPSQLTFVCNAGIFSGSLPIAIFCVKNIIGEKKDRTMLLTRGFLGTTTLYLHTIAYAYLPLAEVATILSITPAMTALIARFSLKEPCSLALSFSLVMTLCGVLLSVRLPELLINRGDFRYDNTYLTAIAASVGCVITISLAFVAIRKLKHIHYSITALYFGILGMIENAVINGATSSYAPVRCGWDRVLYALIGILVFVANCTITLAVQAETVGIVSVVKSSLDIIIAMVFQILFFTKSPDIYNIIGAILVISSLSALGIRNWLLGLPAESKARKRLKHLLL